MKYNIGEIVEWKSQANGSVKLKRGEIVEIITPGRSCNLVWLAKKHNAKSAYGGGIVRDHESYAVLVPGKKDRKPTLYWPRVSKLTKNQP